MRTITLVFILAAIFLPATSAADKRINNMIDIPISAMIDGSAHSLDDVQAAIIKGCKARKWMPVLDREGLIRAKINVRNKHFAEIRIPFSARHYSIIYVSSENLDYSERQQRIHKNYNAWVIKLSQTIDQQLRSASPKEKSGSVAKTDKNDLYSELLKLDELRDMGLLTDEEFEAEKRKLLERN